MLLARDYKCACVRACFSMGITVPPATTTPNTSGTNPSVPTSQPSDTNQQDAFSQFMARMVRELSFKIYVI